MKSSVPQQSFFGKNRGWQLFNMISLITVAVILWAVVVGNEGFAGFLKNWRELDWRWLLVAGGLMGIYLLLEGLELHILTQSLYHGLPYRCSLRTGVIGQLYSALTPFSTGGQPVQLMYMLKDGLDTGGAGSVLTFKSFFYQIGTVTYTLLAVTTCFSFFNGIVPGFQITILLAIGGHMLMTLGMLFLMCSKKWTLKIANGVTSLLYKIRIVKDLEATRKRVEKQIAIFNQSSSAYGRKWGVLIQVLLSTIIQMGALYLVPYAVYRACGYVGQSPFLMLCAVSLVSVVAGMVPLPGGSGGAEGMFLLLFTPLIPGEKLLMVLLLWRIFTYYFNILLGALVVSASRKRQRAVVRLPLPEKAESPPAEEEA